MSLNKIIGSLLLFVILACGILYIASCEKTPIEPSCQCYEYHEKLVYQGMQWKWIHDFDGTTFEDFCSKDNGTYSYLYNDTKRYKFICQ